MPGNASDARALLRWYDRHRRELPWRAPPGATQDPYRVWLSEVMLQQTTAVAVVPYFERFIERFPTLGALAAALETDVLAAWAGLGYYSRARNLHRTARAVAERGLPREPAALAALPGIGAYTAAAVAAIAFGAPMVPVDGNVIRVLARRHAVTEPLPGAMGAIRAAADALAAEPAVRRRAGDFAQALFDLGAGICTPTAPACLLCPWERSCAANAAGIAESLPRKPPKRARPHRYGAHFWLVDDAGRVLLRRRPAAGLLGGMTELPGTAVARGAVAGDGGAGGGADARFLAQAWGSAARVHPFYALARGVCRERGEHPGRGIPPARGGAGG